MRGLKLQPLLSQYLEPKVAPYVGAWIETLKLADRVFTTMSHPTWVRGLKRIFGQEIKNVFKSHPTWVRGLKLADYEEKFP